MKGQEQKASSWLLGLSHNDHIAFQKASVSQVLGCLRRTLEVSEREK